MVRKLSLAFALLFTVAYSHGADIVPSPVPPADSIGTSQLKDNSVTPVKTSGLAVSTDVAISTVALYGFTTSYVAQATSTLASKDYVVSSTAGLLSGDVLYSSGGIVGGSLTVRGNFYLGTAPSISSFTFLDNYMDWKGNARFRGGYIGDNQTASRIWMGATTTTINSGLRVNGNTNVSTITVTGRLAFPDGTVLKSTTDVSFAMPAVLYSSGGALSGDLDMSGNNIAGVNGLVVNVASLTEVRAGEINTYIMRVSSIALDNFQMFPVDDVINGSFVVLTNSTDAYSGLVIDNSASEENAKPALVLQNNGDAHMVFTITSSMSTTAPSNAAAINTDEYATGGLNINVSTNAPIRFWTGFPEPDNSQMEISTAGVKVDTITFADGTVLTSTIGLGGGSPFTGNVVHSTGGVMTGDLIVDSITISPVNMITFSKNTPSHESEVDRLIFPTSWLDDEDTKFETNLSIRVGQSLSLQGGNKAAFEFHDNTADPTRADIIAGTVHAENIRTSVVNVQTVSTVDEFISGNFNMKSGTSQGVKLTNTANTKEVNLLPLGSGSVIFNIPGTVNCATITVSGTVDGRDVSADGARLDGIVRTSTGGAVAANLFYGSAFVSANTAISVNPTMSNIYSVSFPSQNLALLTLDSFTSGATYFVVTNNSLTNNATAYWQAIGR